MFPWLRRNTGRSFTRSRAAVYAAVHEIDPALPDIDEIGMAVNKRNRLFLPLVLALTIGLAAPTAAQEATDYGPPNGTLVIVGGGSMDGTGILEKFIELGGGAEEGRFVIVPTAGGNYDREGALRVYDEDRVLNSWRERGLRNVSMLHTHDAKLADTQAFVADLAQATAVWFNGGRQWNIVDSYAGTRTYDLFHAVLERGGVIGGSSA